MDVHPEHDFSCACKLAVLIGSLMLFMAELGIKCTTAALPDARITSYVHCLKCAYA